MNIQRKNVKDIERHVILVAPDVHWNTGNIGRTCLGAGAHLHLIEPLGFSLDSRQVKRAGLDYWPKVKLTVWKRFSQFMETMQPGSEELSIFSKKGAHSFWNLTCMNRMFLVFGSETRGLPEDITKKFRDKNYYIPISNEIRSLNLSTAVGIVLYESLRNSGITHSY